VNCTNCKPQHAALNVRRGFGI